MSANQLVVDMAAPQHTPISCSPSPHQLVSAVSSTALRRLKLCYLDRVHLFPLAPNSHLSFSKLLSLVAQAFPETENLSSQIELSYSDEDGDVVIIDSEESSTLAALDFEKMDLDVIILQVHVKNEEAGLGGGCADKNVMSAILPASNSALPSASSWQPRIPCRHFQAGSYRYGSSCRFLHSVSKMTPPSPSLNESSRFSDKNATKGISPAPNSASPPAGNRQSLIPCHHFQVGNCRYGSSCRFLHDSNKTAKPSTLSDEPDINEWLSTLNNSSEHDNITYLTSPEGYGRFIEVLNYPHLPFAAFDQLVRLLTRPNLDTSMLRRDTDKIYKALTGSHFLKAMHLHVRNRIEPILSCIEPYVILCKELMSRTREGWEEIPLDELKLLVDEVKDDSMVELGSSLGRLLDLRTKKKRSEAVEENMGAPSLGPSFRDMPVIPPTEQLLLQKNPNPLPVNLVGLPYPSLMIYLETHFKLMQEDFLASLREGIHELRKNSQNASNIHVYTDVRLVGLAGGNDGMVFQLVSFGTGTRHPIDWDSSKRLWFGALLCMSCDGFQTLLWAVVRRRIVQELAKNVVGIQLLEFSEHKSLEATDIYVMTELSNAYFEHYSHVLRNLQRPEMDSLPFQEHLIALDPHVKEPLYLKRRNREDIYDFESAFPDMRNELRTSQFHILETWPEWRSSLDKSQLSGLKHALTKRLALIQGPPGTGKTFLGLLIVKIMLNNLKHTVPTFQVAFQPQKKQEDLQNTVRGPILVVCYSNHALDQFLEGIHAHEQSIVRVGASSKSSKLEACSMKKLLYERKHDFLKGLQFRKRSTQAEKEQLEEQILKCADLMNVKYVTEESLYAVATIEQVQSLFYEGCDTKTVVDMWLCECESAGVVSKSNSSGKSESHEGGEVKGIDCSEKSEIHEGSEVQGVDSSEKSENPGESEVEASGNVEEDRVESIDNSEKPKFHGGSETEGMNSSKTWQTLGETKTDQMESKKLHNVEHEHDYRVDSSTHQCCMKDNMKMIVNRGKKKLESEPTESLWTDVKAKRSEPYILPTQGHHEGMPIKHEEFQVEDLEMLKSHTDVWALHGEDRRALHAHWLNAIHHRAQERMNGLRSALEEVCRRKQEIESELWLSICRKAKIVGMTTGAAARYHSILESLQAEIVVVEEAAVVHDSCILACMTASTKHLVLIGDYLQDRPFIADCKSAEHQLNVSLFERLVKGGVEYVTLEVQRRMRPSISELISSIYPMLRDHESVSTRENIKGMKSNVFFLHHTNPEEHRGEDELEKVNLEEAQLVVELCAYLIKQEYSYSDITILSTLKSQVQEISRRLAQKLPENNLSSQCNESQPKLPQIGSVGDYRGKECKIIILSLVHNNCLSTAGCPGEIGFLADSSYVSVCLSRARDGLFIFGNGDLLSRKSELWEDVVKKLQSSDSYGDALVLACPNHPEREIKVEKPSDFRHAPDGGCDKACEHQLSCGHACPKRCHPGSHDKIVCPKRCPQASSL